MNQHHVIIIGALMELCYLSFYFLGEGPQEVLLFIGVNGVAFLLLAYATYRIRSQPSSTNTASSQLLLIIGFGLLFRITLIPHLPVASDDMYRYVWDGKVAANGFNPFAYAPNDPKLVPLGTDDLPSKINFPGMRSIYPPLAQVFFYCSYWLFGEVLWGMKLLIVLADVASILILALLLRDLNAPPTAVLLYAWSPLPVMYFALDGHIDALGIPFMLLFLYLVLKKKYISGAASLGLSALVKLYPLLLAPFFMGAVRGTRTLLVLVIPIILLAGGYVFYFEPTGGVFESLAVFSASWEFNGSVFKVLQLVTGSDALARVACSIVLLLWVMWLALFHRPLVEKVFLFFLGFILVSPTVHPWYITWLAALLVLRWSLAAFALTGLSNLSNIVVYHYQVTGLWRDQPLLLLLEYLPVFVILGFELRLADKRVFCGD